MEATSCSVYPHAGTPGLPLSTATSAKISGLIQQVYSNTQSSSLRNTSRKTHLKNCLEEIDRMYKIAPEQAAVLDKLKERVTISKTWIELGLDSSILDTDFDSVRF